MIGYALYPIRRLDITLKDTKELFNLRYTSVRNIVERVFSVFKVCFKIFHTTHNSYSIRT
jgi:hypothetical protein